eukprot:4675043-Pyramimonas_sp.AAC.1
MCSLSHPEASCSGGSGVSPETSSLLTTLKLKKWQRLQRWRAGGFQNAARALAPRAFFFVLRKGCKSFTARGPPVFKM